MRHKARPKLDLPKPRTPKTYPVAPPQQVTDHAVIRYLELVMEIDVDQLRHTPHGATLVIVAAKVVSVLRTEEINMGSRVRKTNNL